MTAVMSTLGDPPPRLRTEARTPGSRCPAPLRERPRISPLPPLTPQPQPAAKGNPYSLFVFVS